MSTIGHAPLADDVVVPVPGLWVDRLTDGAEQLSALESRTFQRTHCLCPHQRADRRWRGVELRSPLCFSHTSQKRPGVRVCWHAFEHDGGRAVRKRAIDDIAVAGDPAHIGGAPEDVTLFVVEHGFHGQRGVDQIAAGAVHDAFGLAGGAGGVKDEERIFGVHLHAA